MKTPNIVDPTELGFNPNHLNKIDDLVQLQISRNEYQGMIVLVARHGKVCYFKEFGKADEGKPMQKDAIFRLASMSKVITAVGFMRLWDLGLVSLHDPLSNFIPEFADMKVAKVKKNGTYKLVPAKTPITLHHLLSMTAGFTNSWWDEAFDNPVYKVVPKLYGEAGVRDDMNAIDITLEEYAQRVATVPLIAQPGKMHDYSNTSVDLIARVIEIISGQNFNEYLKEHIFGPLGMDETWFFIPEDQKHRLAETYHFGRDERHTENVQVGPFKLGPEGAHSKIHKFFSGAAGLHGTTLDYFRFAQMLLNMGTLDGVRILSPAAVKLMTSNQIGKLNNWQLTGNKWGYFVDIQEGENSPTNAYLGGPGAYSWQGYYSTKFVNNPAKDTLILTMSAVAADGALPSNLRIIALVNAALEN